MLVKSGWLLTIHLLVMDSHGGDRGGSDVTSYISKSWRPQEPTPNQVPSKLTGHPLESHQGSVDWLEGTEGRAY